MHLLEAVKLEFILVQEDQKLEIFGPEILKQLLDTLDPDHQMLCRLTGFLITLTLKVRLQCIFFFKSN